MKYVKNLFMVFAIIPFLMLQSVGAKADGGEDPPHGRPEMRDDALRSQGGLTQSSGMVGEETSKRSNTPEMAVYSIANLWKYLDSVLGEIR